MVYCTGTTFPPLDNFTRRKTIHIDSSPDGALTDYQIKFTVLYEAAMQADFDDVRFYDASYNSIYQWRGSKTDSVTADFWIKTDVPASGGKDVYMYYGDSTLVDVSDIDNTFIFGDDFTTGTDIDSRWTKVNATTSIVDNEAHVENTDANGGVRSTNAISITDGVIIETRFKQYDAGTNHSIGFFDMTDTTSWWNTSNGDSVHMYFHETNIYRYLFSNGSYESVIISTSPDQNWHDVYIYAEPGQSPAYKYDDTEQTASATVNNVTYYLWLIKGITANNKESYIDWIFTRKHTTNEPATTIGSEQGITHYTRRTKIHINSSPDGALTDYQIPLTIPYKSSMQADFDDLRFFEDNHDVIYQWLESKTDSITATVIIKTDVPASGGKDIWMYYGNPSSTNVSNGSEVFVQYHGSSTVAFRDTAIQAVPFIYKCKAKRIGTSELYFGVTNNDLMYTDDACYISPNVSGNIIYGFVRNEGSYSLDSSTPVWDDDTYYYPSIKAIASNDIKYYPYGDATELQTTTNSPDETMGLGVRVVSGAGEQEWSYIRKYTANEPTTSIGTEQHQRRTPQIMG